MTWSGSFTFNGTNSVNLGTGAVNMSAGTVTVTANANTLTVGGVISGTNLGKSGAGTLVLTNANLYTGTTAVNAGALNVQNASALGATPGGTVTVSGGAVLQLQTGIAVGAKALTINGAGLTASPNGALDSVSGANSWGEGHLGWDPAA